MKTILSLIIATVGFSAQAQDYRGIVAGPDVREAALLQQIDPVFGRVEGGSVTVDFTNKIITLNVMRGFHCPPGRYCAMVMPAPLSYEVRLIKTTKDVCNVVHYKGQVDRRMVDGALTAIEVIDHAHSTCPDLHYRPYIATEVKYLSEGYNRIERKLVKKATDLKAGVLNRRMY